MNASDTPQVRHRTVLDDETRQVARVYAEALFRAAEAKGQVEQVLGELEPLVHEVFKQDPGLELFFASAAVSRDHKSAAIHHAFDGRASDTFINFLEVLNHHDRLDMLRAIAGTFRNLYDRKARRITVHVRSAVPLTDGERGRLCDDIRAVAEVEPILEESVDPDLLGGLVVRVRDWVYDTSVRTRLEKIRNQLIERSSHGIASQRDRLRSGAGD
jgi:F-type H+-transporting ATPase subunit delta